MSVYLQSILHILIEQGNRNVMLIDARGNERPVEMIDLTGDVLTIIERDGGRLHINLSDTCYDFRPV